MEGSTVDSSGGQRLSALAQSRDELVRRTATGIRTFRPAHSGRRQQQALAARKGRSDRLFHARSWTRPAVQKILHFSKIFKNFSKLIIILFLNFNF